MGKGRKKPRKKGKEGHRPKLPAPPPSSRETTKGVSKNTAEGMPTVTEAPSDRQDENPENQECLIDKIKDAHGTTSATESENEKKDVKQNQLKQEVRGRRKKGMGEDVLGIWKLVQEELRRVDYQGLLTKVQIVKGELEAKLRHKERESLARAGTKVAKEEGKDKIPGHGEVPPDRTKIRQNEGTLDPDPDPTAQGKEPRRYSETGRQTSRRQAGQREISKEKDKEKHLTRVEGVDMEGMPKVRTLQSVAGAGMIQK